MSAHIPSESATSFSVATYNIHAWMDVRGRCAPDQTVQVLKNLDADIVALQEVESPLPRHGAFHGGGVGPRARHGTGQGGVPCCAGTRTTETCFSPGSR